MNILFVCEYEWLQAVVFDIHLMAEGLALRGHNIYAIDYEWEDNSQIRLRTREITSVARIYPEARVTLRRPGFVRIRLKHPGFVKLLSMEYLSTVITHRLEIERVIREKKIDVIVLYSVLTNGMSAIRLAKKYNIPVVHRNIDMLHKIVPNPLKRIATRFFEKRVYPRVDKILALTPKYREYLINMGADESRVSLLLFPIDSAMFHPGIDTSDIRRKWGIDDDNRVITYIGGLYPFGALDELILHFPEVLKEVPEARLLIVGDGLARPKLEQLVTENGLDGSIIITGTQPFQDMPKYINAADVCINAFPTNGFTRDLFSAKIVQYLACGKATVCSALPGISTLIPGEENGVVYTETARDMAREIVQLLRSPERRQEMGKAGLEYVRRAHDSEVIINHMEEALRSAIQPK